MSPDTDRDLVRHYWPVALRPAFDALFGIDDALRGVVATSTQPTLGVIRLAWWREALARLDTAAPPPEPRLQAVARELLPRGVRGRDIAGLEDGWAGLLEEEPDPERLTARGAILFGLAAGLLGASDPMIEAAGRLYAMREQIDRTDLDLQPAETLNQLRGHRFPRTLRPLTAMARLAARDFRQWPSREPEATPGRAAALLSHRLFGRVA